MEVMWDRETSFHEWARHVLHIYKYLTLFFSLVSLRNHGQTEFLQLDLRLGVVFFSFLCFGMLLFLVGVPLQLGVLHAPLRASSKRRWRLSFVGLPSWAHVPVLSCSGCTH
ncbi:hypothetical protein TraAM80_02309 [Trypanosoma rangeli]|uniref:Uncharacterized protein n=1 Tax=Trypanosoma rangeli TaxID=5698 RepID=A0A422NUX7_TRYRA|nr:uncharacterized protein TraAM80_02309 [Trypanosoma rangeli]RNF09266.1 hypothetical protein TraAM80_02309 [Trypanosoma rangeli]|eukprot:RNF09266.1 hypothetical protein TraAM80_02309 [Trypanosoma rangeli]